MLIWILYSKASTENRMTDETGHFLYVFRFEGRQNGHHGHRQFCHYFGLYVVTEKAFICAASIIDLRSLLGVSHAPSRRPNHKIGKKVSQIRRCLVYNVVYGPRSRAPSWAPIKI